MTTETGSTPRVFVMEPLTRSSDADLFRYFGPVTPLFAGRCPNPLAFEELLCEVTEALVEARYQPGLDYVAVVGRVIPTTALVLSASGLEVDHGEGPPREDHGGSRLRLLLFDGRQACYHDRLVDLDVALGQG